MWGKLEECFEERVFPSHTLRADDVTAGRDVTCGDGNAEMLLAIVVVDTLRKQATVFRNAGLVQSVTYIDIAGS